MCGILAGINTSYSFDEFEKNLHQMDHRGPDYQKGCAFDNRVFLGHNRLSILDLNERSHQPFSSENYHMVFNGEIYNYKELIKEHNLNVSTTSDTEVVLEMYKKYGHKCLPYFNGMFAMVIYNSLTKDTFVARDRLGIKPIYFYNSSDEWIFSSEVAPIQSMVNSEIDDFGIRQYRKLRMTVNGYTLYSKIKMFPPGHYWINGSFHKYWELDYSSKPAPSDEQVKDLIENAVQLRSRSDVPVGSYLSGGLDSTILSYILNPEDTWIVGFPELNEFEWGKKANSKLKSTHHRIEVNKDQFLEAAEFMVNKRKEPLSVPNEVLIYLMTKEVKKRNTVVLSGEGADELFYGYDRIFKWANRSKSFDLKEFDKHYCYGSNEDYEVVDYALEGINYKSPIDIVGYFFQIQHLQGLLRRLDNSTMLCSVEARVPFVDHRLVELLAGVPFDWKMGSSFKEPLKRIFGNKLPQEIISREKVGFPLPLDHIFSDTNFEGNGMDKWLLFNIETFLNNK